MFRIGDEEADKDMEFEGEEDDVDDNDGDGDDDDDDDEDEDAEIEQAGEELNLIRFLIESVLLVSTLHSPPVVAIKSILAFPFPLLLLLY